MCVVDFCLMDTNNGYTCNQKTCVPASHTYIFKILILIVYADLSTDNITCQKQILYILCIDFGQSD